MSEIKTKAQWLEFCSSIDSNFIYIDDAKNAIHSKTSILMDVWDMKLQPSKVNKFRKVLDKPFNFSKELDRQDLKMARFNLEVDKSNKFYEHMYKQAQINWEQYV